MALKWILAGAIRLFCGAVVRSPPPGVAHARPVVYFANHTSNADFAVVWAALPDRLRAQTRPVAGRDYWQSTAVRRWVAGRLFRAILIERKEVNRTSNPLPLLLEALDAGDSIILFPEGTRSATGQLQPFRAGLYHLARQRPTVPLVPAHLNNLTRVLPKGEIFPLPLLASVAFGEALYFRSGETRTDFLLRTQAALGALGGGDTEADVAPSTGRPTVQPLVTDDLARS